MKSSGGNLVALVLGATGETGKEVVKQLLLNRQISKLILVGRRAIPEVDLERREGMVRCHLH